MDDRKLKVLVADDEYWIRENMKTVIDWDALGLELLPMATDGEDALGKMEKSPADIVITDINMPYMSGVELMKALRARWPNTVIVVLSGYSDFEYVHQALLAGAIDYILKPLNRSKLLEVIQRAVEQAIVQTRRRRERDEEQARLKLAASMVSDRDFSQWLHDAKRQEQLQSVEAKLFDYEMSFSSYRVLLIKLPGFMRNLGRGDLPPGVAQAVYRIKTAVEELADEGSRLVIHDLYHANHFLLVTEMDETALRSRLPQRLKEWAALSGVQPRVMISSGYFSFRDLRRAYDEVRRCLSAMPCCSGAQIGFAPEADKQTMVQRIHPDMQHQLMHAARQRQRERFEALLEQTGIYRCAQDGWTGMELLHSVNHVVWILRHLSEESMNASQLVGLDNLLELLLDAVDRLEFDQLRSLFGQLLDEYFGPAETAAQSDTIRGTVRRVREYIDAHYDEPLSLSALAQRFHVDDSYLSRMFKQQVGCNLMLYLAGTRMAQAKRLLLQKEMSITDVAQMVGYDDYAYFSRVFKRMEGKSPRAYREEEL